VTTLTRGSTGGGDGGKHHKPPTEPSELPTTGRRLTEGKRGWFRTAKVGAPRTLAPFRGRWPPLRLWRLAANFYPY